MINAIFFGIITLILVVVAVVVVRVLLELRAGLAMMKESVQKAETSILPVLSELQLSLHSLRQVTDDIGSVTEDVRAFSGNVRRIGENVQRISGLVEEITETGAVTVAGLKAGVRVGLSHLVKNFLKGKEKSIRRFLMAQNVDNGFTAGFSAPLFRSGRRGGRRHCPSGGPEVGQGDAGRR